MYTVKQSNINVLVIRKVFYALHNSWFINLYLNTKVTKL